MIIDMTLGLRQTVKTPHFIPTIYSITNKRNGRQYFGCAENALNRLVAHICALNSDRHVNKALLADWDDISNFRFEILESEKSRTKAEAIETKYIQSVVNPYNVRKRKREMK